MVHKSQYIKNCEDFRTDQTYSYPGDNETFGTGASLSRELGLTRVAVNYEVLEPGDRSSWPHAHSEAEEFIFILEGFPEVWIDGDVFPLKPGDCVGLPGGTGYSHTLLNNSDKNVRALVMGECSVPTDKIIYPMHPKRNDEMKVKGVFWEKYPEQNFGSHDGQTNLKREK